MDTVMLPPQFLGLVPFIVWAVVEAAKRGLPIPPRILGFTVSLIAAIGLIGTGLVDVGLGDVPGTVQGGDPWLIGSAIIGVTMAAWKVAQAVHDVLQAAGVYGSGGDGGPTPG